MWWFLPSRSPRVCRKIVYWNWYSTITKSTVTFSLCRVWIERNWWDVTKTLILLISQRRNLTKERGMLKTFICYWQILFLWICYYERRDNNLTLLINVLCLWCELSLNRSLTHRMGNLARGNVWSDYFTPSNFLICPENFRSKFLILMSIFYEARLLTSYIHRSTMFTIDYVNAP